MRNTKLAQADLYTLIVVVKDEKVRHINMLGASVADDITDIKQTLKRQKKMPMLRKIKRAASRHTSQRFCSTFNFTQPHPKPTHHPNLWTVTI